jgi:hypothetical protein
MLFAFAVAPCFKYSACWFYMNNNYGLPALRKASTNWADFSNNAGHWVAHIATVQCIFAGLSVQVLCFDQL